MALRPVPWAIGHGAHNAAEGARLSLYAGTGGARGVMAPTDMRVTALPVPGAAVRISEGAAVMPNDYVPGASQSYAIEEESSTDFPITATGSSGGAIRYLIARVMDDQYAGQAPANVKNGPYCGYQWLSTDPRVAPPAYPWDLLARVDQPANTATITPAMVTDLREIAQPMIVERSVVRPVIVKDITSIWSHSLNHVVGENGMRGEKFPDVGNDFKIKAPDGANRVIIHTEVTGVRYDGRLSNGPWWVTFGPDGQGEKYTTQDFAWDSLAAGDPYTGNLLLTEELALPADCRGKLMNFTIRAGIDDRWNTVRGAMSLTARSGMSMSAKFLKATE